MKQLKVLTLILVSIIRQAHSQQLLNPLWEKTVCSGATAASHLYSSVIDDSGNVYTLGAFAGQANCLGDTYNYTTGDYFLVKQSPGGSKMNTLHLGSKGHYENGQLKLCKNGDIVIGGSFIKQFFYNENLLESNNAFSSNFIAVFNNNLQLKWYKIFKSKSASSFGALEVDSDNNIYAAVFSYDTLFFENTYSSKWGGSTLLKYDSSGMFKWDREIHTVDQYAYNQTLFINDICINKDNSTGYKVYLKGFDVQNNKVYFDGALVAQSNSSSTGQNFAMCLDAQGNHFQTRFFDPGFNDPDGGFNSSGAGRSVIGLYSYNDQVYFAGSFRDSVIINNTVIKPENASSLYIAAINENIQVTEFHSLQTNEKITPNVFTISDDFGYIIAGSYNDKLSIQSATLSAGPLPGGNSNYYGFISNFNWNYTLKDLKYIKGRASVLCIETLNDDMYGASVFGDTCIYGDHINYAYTTDVSVFKTNDILKLNTATGIGINQAKHLDNLVVVPNPSNGNFSIQLPANAQAKYTYQVVDISGRIMEAGTKENQGKSINFNLSGAYPGGLYVLKLNSDKEQYTYKLMME